MEIALALTATPRIDVVGSVTRRVPDRAEFTYRQLISPSPPSWFVLYMVFSLYATGTAAWSSST